MSRSSLKQVGELFGNIGWEKRLCDLNEEEVLAITLILKRISEGLDDEYSSTTDPTRRSIGVGK